MHELFICYMDWTTTQTKQIWNDLDVSFSVIAVVLPSLSLLSIECVVCVTSSFVSLTYLYQYHTYWLFLSWDLKKKPKYLKSRSSSVLCSASLIAQGAFKVLLSSLSITTSNPTAFLLYFYPNDCPFSALVPLQYPILRANHHREIPHSYTGC